MPYCTPADLHAFGVPRGATPNPGRVLAAAVNSTCTLDGHGFETGDEVSFRPAGDGTMPAGLVAGTPYYAQAEGEYSFKVRTTPGGAALSFTDAEDPLMVIAPLDRASAIEYADRLIDDMAAGQAVPFDDVSLYPDGVPAIIKMTSAELAAVKLLSVTGSASRSLADAADAAAKRLARWAQGLPVRETPAETRAQVAAVAVSPYADRRGWSRFGGL